jgi:hypothetical protein
MGIAFEMALASLRATPDCNDPIRAAFRSASSRWRKPASAIPSASVRAPCGNQSIHRPGASFRKAAGPPKLTLHQFRQDRAGHNAADEEARRFPEPERCCAWRLKVRTLSPRVFHVDA